jgi:predicted transcriptional regulator
MESKSSKAFCLWRKRMGLSYHQAAQALGLCTSAVGFYSRGTRKNQKESEEKIVDVPKTVLLACKALEHGLPPIK